MNENKKLSLRQAVSIFIGGILFFTLPYGFAWYLVKGGNFATGFVIYLEIIAATSLLIGSVSGIVAGIIKFLRIPLDNKPKLPDLYMVPMMIITFGASIAAGMADGAITGLLVFWPAGFFSMCIVHSAHWIQYQVKKIRSRQNT